MTDETRTDFRAHGRAVRERRTTTAFRLLQAALEPGRDVNVFAYEGAVALSFARQAAMPTRCMVATPRGGSSVARDWIAALMALAAKQRRRSQLGELRTVRR